MGEYDVVTFGSATLDVFLSSENFKVVEGEEFIAKKGLCAPLGSKMKMDSVVFAMGGTGANAAVTFSLQGYSAAYLGLIGKDPAGAGVKDELSQNNVSLDLLKETEKWPTAYSTIISLPEVGRSILKKLGACHEISESDIPFDKLKAKWLYLGSLSGGSYKIMESVVKFAAENNIKVAANPVGDKQLTDGLKSLISLLSKMQILIVNQEEASILTGIDYKREKDIFKKFDELVDGVAVMTKGPEGVTISDGKHLYSAGIPKSGLVDRTGAGDAFGSAFVAGWMRKEDIAYAVQLATANATSCLQKIGAAKGLLKRSDWGPWDKVEVLKEKL